MTINLPTSEISTLSQNNKLLLAIKAKAQEAKEKITSANQSPATVPVTDKVEQSTSSTDKKTSSATVKKEFLLTDQQKADWLKGMRNALGASSNELLPMAWSDDVITIQFSLKATIELDATNVDDKRNTDTSTIYELPATSIHSIFVNRCEKTLAKRDDKFADVKYDAVNRILTIKPTEVILAAGVINALRENILSDLAKDPGMNKKEIKIRKDKQVSLENPSKGKAAAKTKSSKKDSKQKNEADKEPGNEIRTEFTRIIGEIINNDVLAKGILKQEPEKEQAKLEKKKDAKKESLGEKKLTKIKLYGEVDAVPIIKHNNAALCYDTQSYFELLVEAINETIKKDAVQFYNKKGDKKYQIVSRLTMQDCNNLRANIMECQKLFQDKLDVNKEEIIVADLAETHHSEGETYLKPEINSNKQEVVADKVAPSVLSQMEINQIKYHLNALGKITDQHIKQQPELFVSCYLLHFMRIALILASNANFNSMADKKNLF